MMISSDKINPKLYLLEYILQISYISMAPNQTIQPQQKSTIIPVSTVKPTTVSVAAVASPRATAIVTATSRKRDQSGKSQFESIL